MNPEFVSFDGDMTAQIAQVALEIEEIQQENAKSTAALDKVAGMLKALPHADSAPYFDWDNVDFYDRAPVREDYIPYRDKLVAIQRATREKLNSAQHRLAAAQARHSLLQAEQAR